jgi:hypothetical protein
LGIELHLKEATSETYASRPERADIAELDFRSDSVIVPARLRRRYSKLFAGKGKQPASMLTLERPSRTMFVRRDLDGFLKRNP